MRVVIVGERGQLGQALVDAIRTRQPDWQVEGWNRPVYDISRPEISRRVVESGADLVINTAAWTNVDDAESAPDEAYAVNALGPRYLAEGCADSGATLVQISTNEVFAGDPGRTYREYDLPGPGGVYARSKSAGERAAQATLARLFVVRVAWLYGRGQNDFPSKILGAAKGRERLRIVADEYGNPTYAPHAARAILELIQTRRYGVYHAVNEGASSRFEWAQYFFQALQHPIELEPIPASAWPRAVQPPAHAVLVNQTGAALGVRLPDWREGVEAYIQSGVLDGVNTA